MVDRFRGRMSEGLEQDYAALREMSLLNQLQDAMRSEIVLPEQFIKHMISHRYEHDKKELTEEALENELVGTRRSIILDKLAEQLKVELEYADVHAETMNAVRSTRNAFQMDQQQLSETADKLLSQPDRKILNQMMSRARFNKVLNVAASNASLTEQTVSYSEFQKLANQE
jgi:FKBP-type peptidyl-prolyl cis-trans isomerase (trigger factor)